MSFKYRADQVGSLLRPADILNARKNGDPNLKEVEDREILRVLGKQKELGLQIFTDGEFRRYGFMSDFNDSVEGLDNEELIAREWKGQGEKGKPGLNRLPGVVYQKIRQKKRLTSGEIGFLQKNSPGDIKMTLPTANQFPAIMYKKGISEAAYPTYSDFLWDIVPIFKGEIAALVNDGVKYIQIDAPRYSYYIDPKWRKYVQDEMGVDPDKALDEAIKVDNACLEGVKRDGVVFAMHLCRGNNRSQWYAEGGYDPIAEKLFGQLNVDAFLLEYESARAGTFEPLRHLPKGKVAVLGLVSSKVPDLESKDNLKRRVEEATKYVPLENLAISPQCGFASMLEGNLLTEQQQWDKLQLVVETAKEIWK